MQLVSLMYVCESRESLTPDEVEKIITNGNKENIEDNVTSFMILIDEVLMQVIEGEDDKVEKAYLKMESNIHLCNFHIIFRHGLPRRTFDKWSLGYAIVNHDDLGELEEFKDMDKKEFYEKLHKDIEIYSNDLLLHFYNKKVNENETGTENSEVF